MGRKRKPRDEKKSTVFLRLPNPVIDKIEDKMGDKNKACEKIVLENYQKYVSDDEN